MTRGSRTGAIAAIIAAFVSAAAAGCGRPTAEIEGTVTYRGQPIPRGIVAVFVGEGRVVTGGVAEGRFAVHGVPLGEGVVTVECDTPADPAIKPPPGEKIFPFDNPALPKATGPAVTIPSRYQSPATSPLRVAPVAGPQKFDIVLVDE